MKNLDFFIFPPTSIVKNMKITTSQLRRIIKEEVSRVIMEAENNAMALLPMDGGSSPVAIVPVPVPGQDGLGLFVKYVRAPGGVFAYLVSDNKELEKSSVPHGGDLDYKYMLVGPGRVQTTTDEEALKNLYKQTPRMMKKYLVKSPLAVSMLTAFLKAGGQSIPTM